MGYARWNADDWDHYLTRTAGIPTSNMFGRSLHGRLDPSRVKVRESFDSDLNPLSTPIIVAVDDTGSMGVLAEVLIRKGLGVIIEEIYQRKPVTDPHVMCMAVGDAWCDKAPLQVTQFEADNCLVQQLADFWIEGGGGGNSYESYNLPWYFAATRTRCDSFLKRGKKGYLFTVGDEPPPPALLSKHVQRFLGDKLEHDLPSTQVLAMACQSWEVFHIIIEQGGYYRGHPAETRAAWQALLGQRAIGLSDHDQLAELIVSTIEVIEGGHLDAVARSWTGNTAMIVRQSLSPLSCGAMASGTGFTRL